MRLRSAVCVAVASLVMTACGSVQSKPQELHVPPERIVLKGYSLMPPNERGWLMAGRNQYQLALVKAGGTPDETIAIQAMPVKLPDFESPDDLVRLIKEGQAKDTDPKRFAIKKSDVVAYALKDSTCAKAYHVAEDNSAVKRSGKSGNMILEVLTLTCAHPKAKNVGVNVTYSHRHYPDQGGGNFEDKAMSVLESVEFTELSTSSFNTGNSR